MIINSDGAVTIITHQNEPITDFVNELNTSYSKFKNNNIIVNLSSLKEFSLDDILQFLLISTKHRANKHSFVIVTDQFNLNLTPDELIIVPTEQEAYDIIEMEDIERDLEF